MRYSWFFVLMLAMCDKPKTESIDLAKQSDIEVNEFPDTVWLSDAEISNFDIGINSSAEKKEGFDIDSSDKNVEVDFADEIKDAVLGEDVAEDSFADDYKAEVIFLKNDIKDSQKDSQEETPNAVIVDSVNNGFDIDNDISDVEIVADQNMVLDFIIVIVDAESEAIDQVPDFSKVNDSIQDDSAIADLKNGDSYVEAAVEAVSGIETVMPEITAIDSFNFAGWDIDFLETNVFPETNTFPCSDVGGCPPEFICHNNAICCPPNLPQLCGNQCFPQNCACVEDGVFILCLPDGWEYCEKGISCKTNEASCSKDGEKIFCLKKDEFVCGNGLVCKTGKEECQNVGGQYYCVPVGYIYCSETKYCIKNWEVCVDGVCCPAVQPLACGETCCDKDEQCADPDKAVCIPEKGIYCNGAVCWEGEKCAFDGMPVCYPANGDYCGKGRWCKPGWKCTSTSCCPDGTPKECGHLCCHQDYDCVGNGIACVHPDYEYCPETGIICPPLTFCALNGTICLEDNTDVCEDGHWCEPGKYCSGPTCCPEQDPAPCGNLCCAKNWICIGNGVDCIPPDAQYCEISGKWCPSGTKCSSDGECMLSGWTDCLTGVKCPPKSVCSAGGMKCCSEYQPYWCGAECCENADKCFGDGACLPSGAVDCKGVGPNDYCPVGTYCGKYSCVAETLEECEGAFYCPFGTCGKTTCLPWGWEECDDGQFCPPNQLCTEYWAGPPCCPDEKPIACVNKCCQEGNYCCGTDCCATGMECYDLGTLNYDKSFCAPPGVEICEVTMTYCEDGFFCGFDGACLPDELKGTEYNYCGGGAENICQPITIEIPFFGEITIGETECAGFCSNHCCEKAPESNEECNLADCLTMQGGLQAQCQDDYFGASKTCCAQFWDTGNEKLKQIQECGAGQCDNIKCVAQDTGHICCTYNYDNTVGCLTGCVASGQLCQDIILSNSVDAYINPMETGLLPKNVAYEIGEHCPSGAMPPTIILNGANVYFNPAGYAPFYDSTSGIYHAEEELDNWIQSELGKELLVVIAVLIVDNLEGIDCPHGPYAQLYILIHHLGDEPADLNHWTSKQINKKAVYGYNKYHLKGPLSGNDSWKICACIGISFLDLCFDVKCWTGWGDEFDTNVEEEWVDNLYVKYPIGKAGIYQWEEGEEAIYITLRESDGEPKFGRVDDYMGLSLVSKETTKEPCGVVIPLIKYDNVKEDNDKNNDWDFDPGGTGAYHYPTGIIGGYLWLKTFTCNNKPGNPC